MKQTLLINEEEKGKRLDRYLAEKLEELSRSYIQKLIDEGLITVNGKAGKPGYRLRAGDSINVEVPEPKDTAIRPVEMELDILYEDEDILLVNKPPGLVVHPVPGNQENTLVNGLLHYTDNLSGISGEKRPGIVHRLDKDTSGALIVAKNDKSHRNLVEQFRNREILKIYHTIVKGSLPHEKGIIDAPIGRDPLERKRMAVRKDNSKRAVSEFRVIERFNGYTYLEVKLETGRTHQIRVHFSYLGYPVLGDGKYGRKKKNDPLKAVRQMLHAYILGFKHPVTGQWLEIKAPLPRDFLAVIDEIRGAGPGKND
ncbi:MAG: RluA family pseudouridine synthase [Halanaerobiaceae bacterium]|jgi:23S rRNA pseudouridine1911/1915/1917 synthase|nr:RluA family pseudouridine synthase [Halanaerobiaceae bacterium]